MLLPLTLLLQTALAGSYDEGVKATSLPSQALFPGPWNAYIQAPANKSYIKPRSTKWIDQEDWPPVKGKGSLGGNADASEPLRMWRADAVAFDFKENIGGRYA